MATTKCLETKVCTINGLRLSRKHPVKLADAWLCPRDLAPVIHLSAEQPLPVYNLVLSAGGAASINGMSVITLGDDVAAGRRPPHPYYGTPKVVADLMALPSWPACAWPPARECARAAKGNGPALSSPLPPVPVKVASAVEVA